MRSHKFSFSSFAAALVRSSAGTFCITSTLSSAEADAVVVRSFPTKANGIEHGPTSRCVQKAAKQPQNTDTMDFRGRLPAHEATLLSRAVAETWPGDVGMQRKVLSEKLNHILFSSIDELCTSFLYQTTTPSVGDRDTGQTQTSECKLNQELRKFGEDPLDEDKVTKLFQALFYHRLSRKFHLPAHETAVGAAPGAATRGEDEVATPTGQPRAETPKQHVAAAPAAEKKPPAVSQQRESAWSAASTTVGGSSASGGSASSSSEIDVEREFFNPSIVGNRRLKSSNSHDAALDRTSSTASSADAGAAQQVGTAINANAPSRNGYPSAPAAPASCILASAANSNTCTGLPMLFTAPHSIPLKRDGDEVHKQEDWTSSLASALAISNSAASICWNSNEGKRIKAANLPADPALRDPNFLHVDELEKNFWFNAMREGRKTLLKACEARPPSSPTSHPSPFTLHVDVHGCMNPAKPPHYYSKEVFLGFAAMENFSAPPSASSAPSSSTRGLESQRAVDRQDRELLHEGKKRLAESFRRILKRNLDLCFQTYYAPGSIVEDRPTTRLTGAASDPERMTLTQQSQLIGFDVSVQLELSHGLRKALFNDLEFKRDFCLVWRNSYCEMAQKEFGIGIGGGGCSEVGVSSAAAKPDAGGGSNL